MALPHIWVIDDQPEADMLVAWLDGQGYRATRVDFKTALRSPIGPECPSLILLELIQPEIGGLVLCWKLRQRTTAPILVYSATRRSGDSDASRRLGASAFVHKSIPFAELALTVEALLRSPLEASAGVSPLSQPKLRVGDLVIDAARFRAQVNDTPVDLTPPQLRILLALARTPGKVVSYAELDSSLWTNGHAHSVRSLGAHVQRIRLKLRMASEHAPRLVAVRRVGYVLSVSDVRLDTSDGPPRMLGAA
jgi:DNA-binding response OmpR family regulator